MNGEQDFTVANWEVNPSLCLLERGGTSTKLKPRTMQLLVYLASRPGQLITRDDLIANVWNGRTVSDGAIYQAVNLLRKALEDERDNVRFIQTIPRKGYRLIAPVEHERAKILRLGKDPVPPATRKRLRRIATTSGLSLVAVAAVAAVALFFDSGSAPTSTATTNAEARGFFENANFFMNETPNDESTRLALEMYQQAVTADPDFAEAWAALSAAHMVMYANKSRDRSERRRAMALQAVEKAIQLNPQLPEAHDALGRYFYGIGEHQRALEEYEIALRGHPDDSDLLQRFARVHEQVGDLNRAVTLRERADDLDPRNVELLANLADDHLLLREYIDAERYLRRALERRPDLYDVRLDFSAWLPLARDGDADTVREALAYLARSDPDRQAGIRERWLGWLAAIYDEDFGSALAYLSGIEREINESGFYYFPTASFLAATYRLAGDAELAEHQFRVARELLEEAYELYPNDDRLYVALAEVSAGLGETGAALEWVSRALTSLPERPYWRHMRRYYLITQVLAPFGFDDLAIEQLEIYLDEPGEWSIEGLLPDPRLDPIRDDPRFEALIAAHRRS